MYVSPDLGRVNERVLIDGVPVTESDWNRWADQIEDAGRDLDEMPSWFETVTALAFLAFADTRVDIAVVEVGLGGRLDATNVIPPPLLSIITPVAFDHMRFLGSTIEAIAREKAGILKSGSELVLARQPFAEARAVIVGEAAARRIPVHEVRPRAAMTQRGPELVADDGRVVRTGLLGAYQADNLDTAWTGIERLSARGWVPRTDAAARALKDVEWPGRFQVVSRDPLIVVDGAHNPHGMMGVAKTLALPPWNRRRWHAVFGALDDKAWDTMIEIVSPHIDALTVTRIPGERSSDPSVQAEKAPPGIPVWVIDDPASAVLDAKARLERGEALLITGSLSLLAHLRQRHVYEQTVSPSVD